MGEPKSVKYAPMKIADTIIRTIHANLGVVMKCSLQFQPSTFIGMNIFPFLSVNNLFELAIIFSSKVQTGSIHSLLYSMYAACQSVSILEILFITRVFSVI